MKERKSLEDYLVKPGEQSPFANLLVDLAFKKAFDPDKPTSRENLVNLLNDLLAPQLKRPIKNVWTRNVSKRTVFLKTTGLSTAQLLLIWKLAGRLSIHSISLL